MARGLTVKQRMFVAALLGPAHGNQTVAARMAQYAGDDAVLSVQGARNMQIPKIRQLIDEKCEQMLDRSLEVYEQALSATTRKAFLTKQGQVTYSAPEPHWKVKMDAANRVLKRFEQPVAREGASCEPDTVPKQEDTELEQKIGSLSSTDRALLGRTCELEERLSEVDRQLAEDSNGPERQNEN